MPTDTAATALFVDCARVMARARSRGELLEGLLGALAAHLEIGSSAVFVPASSAGVLEPVATFGLDEAAAGALAAAVRNPSHPVARTAADGASTFDVRPRARGGPALRSHIALVAARDGGPTVVGVLAIAHEAQMTPVAPLLEAVGDLAAASVRPGAVDAPMAG